MPNPFGDTVAVLLCAGLSRRYGKADKLLAPLSGRPLAAHAAAMLAGLPFLSRIAVVQAGWSGVPLLGSFDIVKNPRPEDGQDSSLRLGLAAALYREPRAILVCLADMPFVTPDHLAAVAAHNGAAISGKGPPTLIPADLARLILADPTRPARDHVRSASPAVVTADPLILRDFDRPEDFA
ncbi:NTP transferase domain-containing protein [Sphingomonas sp. ID0503]|uniref:NTP transferase domain-containing protein n=1 Tax=Sphingomonas sp. ID0503 TaxID=3399691 RepID=UPI003AFAD484